MAFYQPDNFILEEFFPPYFFKAQYPIYGKRLWTFMDYRVLYTQQRLRLRYGTMIMNTWHSDKMVEKYGNHQWRGYRDHTSPYVKRSNSPEFGNISQHRLGQAADSVPLKTSASKIREDILADPWNDDFKYITCIELEVSWLHFDVRNWNKRIDGILQVSP